VNGIALNNVRDYWDNCLDKFPGKVAAIYNGQEYIYRQLDAAVKNLASHLHNKFGVSRGDTVCISMPNCIEFFTAYWAVVRLGGVVVPVNIRLQAEEMGFVMANSDARVLLTHADTWKSTQEALAQCRNVKHIIGAGVGEKDVVDFDELTASSAGDFAEPAIKPDDVIIIMHTSGTTGRPKGAVMTHGNIVFNVRMSIIAHSMRHEDVHLLVAPMFHCTALYSMLPGSAYLGSTIVIAPNPDVLELVRLVERHKITTFISVPTLLHFLTTLKDLDDYDLSSLKMISYAGSPMPPQTIHRLRKKFPHVELRNFFGLTETISVTHVLPSVDATRKPDSVGKLLPEVAMRIVDENGNDVPNGEVGELCFARENVVREYWKRPDLMEEAMLPPDRKWFRTGDYAMVDEEGYLFLKGRKKEMIIVGGENVYALEVESVLLSHPKVREAAVVGVEAKGIRAYLGELVKAVIVPEPGQELAEREIKQHCIERLASYKVPQIVEFRDALPRNPAGKVMKQALKDARA